VKIREPNLMWIIIEAGSTRVSYAVILAMNAKTVKALITPGEFVLVMGEHAEGVPTLQQQLDRVTSRHPRCSCD